MIWVVISLIIIIASIVLAIYRYLILTAHLQHLDSPPTIFIVQNRAILTPLLIEQLVSELPSYYAGVSFEMLKKGQDQILLLALPRWILTAHPEIKVIEIEDYLPIVNNQGINIICLQFTDPNLKTINSGFFRPLFDQLQLSNNESLFIQLVARPLSPNSSDLDANIRVIISAPDAGRSSQIEQRFFELLKQYSSLVPKTNHQNASKIMDNFRTRSFAKHESLCCPLTATEFSQFLI